MKIPVLAALAFAVVLAAGCSIFHHKKNSAPEVPPSAGIEADFRDRWINQRVHDLLAANPALPEADARATATAAFAKQYPYLRTVNGQGNP